MVAARRLPYLASGLFALVMIAAGCSGSATVHGTITYLDQPVESGQIHFIGDNGASRSTIIGPQGHYEVVDVPKGRVRVVIESYRYEGGAAGGSSPIGIVNDAKVPKTSPPKKISRIPAKYSDPASSELTYDISNGRQTIDIVLKD